MGNEKPPAGESSPIKVTVSSDKLEAVIIAGSDAGPPDRSMLAAALERAGVNFGVDQTAIDAFLANPTSGPTIIARGDPPEAGKDARIEFKVDLNPSRLPKVATNGHIDYKNIDFLQNATAGSVLALKHPATSGRKGTSVLGTELSAPDGKDIPLPQGTNTEVSENGLTLTATADGSVVYAHNKISIQPVTTISGDVNIETGNINAVGSLRVSGNIESGFEVKVAGDLEVGGNVGDSTIECGGNVLVKGCFIGQGLGAITAVGNVTIGNVDNQTVEAGGDIVIGGEAINAHLHAGLTIDFKSKKGKMVGGEITARNQIHAHVLGNDAGTTTVVRVGYDAELMRNYYKTKKEIERIENDIERVKEALYSLHRLKLDDKLPEAKKPVLVKLDQFMQSVPGQLEALQNQKTEYEKKIEENSKAKIIVEDEANLGVELHFGLVYLQLDSVEKCRVYSNEYGKVTSAPVDHATVTD